MARPTLAHAPHLISHASRDASWLHLAVHGEVGPEGGALSLHDGPFAAASVLRERPGAAGGVAHRPGPWYM